MLYFCILTEQKSERTLFLLEQQALMLAVLKCWLCPWPPWSEFWSQWNQRKVTPIGFGALWVRPIVKFLLRNSCCSYSVFCGQLQYVNSFKNSITSVKSVVCCNYYLGIIINLCKDNKCESLCRCCLGHSWAGEKAWRHFYSYAC